MTCVACVSGRRKECERVCMRMKGSNSVCVCVRFLERERERELAERVSRSKPLVEPIS